MGRFERIRSEIQGYRDSQVEEFKAAAEDYFAEGGHGPNLYIERFMEPKDREALDRPPYSRRKADSIKQKAIDSYARNATAAANKQLKRLGQAEAAPDLEYIRIDVEWVESPTWGPCPKAELWADGCHFTGQTVKGYGYDQLSTATAEALNAAPAVTRLLCEAYERGDAMPYGVCVSKGRLPSFMGGCGIDRQEAFFDQVGAKWHHQGGEGFDSVQVDGFEAFYRDRGGTGRGARAAAVVRGRARRRRAGRGRGRGARRQAIP